MYNYEQFKQALLDALSESMNKKGYEARIIEVNGINKISENVAAYKKNSSDVSITLSIKVESIFESYKSGERFDKLVSQTEKILTDSMHDNPILNFNPEIFRDKNILDNVVMDVINTDMNREMLQNVPGKRIEDLSVIYRIDLSSALGCNKDVMASVIINKEIQKMIGADTEQLHERAILNMRKKYPVKVTPIIEVIAEMVGKEKFEALYGKDIMLHSNEDFLYVMKSENYDRGASSIVYSEDVLDDFIKDKGKDVFIIPSSIHEVLLFPDDGKMTVRDLREMVKQVNFEVVAENEKLSDNVYRYAASERSIKIAMDNERIVRRGITR